ncbi:sugar phosphate nucleotidyltransferase [Bacillus sp. SCS-151]|uniref:sugar phosphate nucleotidyltransferase n=1 Tax=Nanhaiella sioensis TaxID=3115293 RepID=UPI00397C1E2E
MNQTMLGIIDATQSFDSIQQLTINRSVAAIPFAGRYRLIDFVLSNMVNSGITSVAIFPKDQYRSLMDHIEYGKQWDLNRKRDGLFFFPSAVDSQSEEFNVFRQYKNNIDYFLRSKQQYVLISNCYTVCNIDYQAILQQHIESHCDITEIAHNGKPMGMYIFNFSLLFDLITNYEKFGYTTIQDVVLDPSHHLQICRYEYEGYVAKINTIKEYYTQSLELLKPQVWKELFNQINPIYTKVKDEPPTKYMNGSRIKNSFIANGCKIEGEVENSIIFRSVNISKGTVVKDSIIMQKSQIGENCVLNGVILDKDVKVENNVILTGDYTTPYIVPKGTIQGALMNT